MKTIVIEYLNTSYKITLSSYVSYKIKDIYNNTEVSLKHVFDSLGLIFSLTDEEVREIFDTWVDIKATELNNLVVDIQTKIFLETGQTMRIDVETMNGLIEEMEVRENKEDMDRFFSKFNKFCGF